MHLSDSYDAATFDTDEKAFFSSLVNVITEVVRFNRQKLEFLCMLFGLKLNYNISPNLKTSLMGKYIGHIPTFWKSA